MNNVVLITGASSGMGKATAKLLVQNGYIVYAAARRIEKMDDLKVLGANILKMDVTDEKSMANIIDLIIQKEGAIDILINNAGFGLLGAIEDVPVDEAKYQMDVNVFGVSRLIQSVLPAMRKHGFGKIINITSTSGKMASPLSGWYSASKFAVEALSDSLRMEVKQFGIDVIIIEPGGVKSEWSDIAMESLKVSVGKAYSKMAEKIVDFSKKSAPKMAEPEVIAALILNSIIAKNPKTRYHGGHMAGVILFLKKALPDKLFDKLLLSQMK